MDVPDGETRTADAGSLSAEIDDLLGLHERMMAIRRFEEEVQRQFQRGEVPGTTHLCNGHEAVSVGVAAAMHDDDVIATTYRGHGHVLARGAEPLAVAGELVGRAMGINGGRGGSMNLTDFSKGVLGSFGIIGGSIACATGAGLSLRRTGRAAVATFGDGATNQGYFFECLNFAAVFKLPVLFVCENNLYGEYTHWEETTAGGDITARAAVFGIRSERIDGMDVRGVREAARGALDRARAGEGPQFLECRTYRFVGHSRSDPATYRKPGELDEWLQRDPLKLAREELERLGVPPAVLDEVDGTARDDARRAFADALAAPYPEPLAVTSGAER